MIYSKLTLVCSLEDWMSPSSVTLGGVATTAVTFKSVLSVGSGNPNTLPTALFNMTTYFFPSAASVPYGSTTLDVPANSLKFTASIEDWPFLGTNNSLTFGVDVKFKSRDGSENVSSTDTYER